ncbi:MAG TPA: coagulation factor 5/8 type domain-containing protein [Clostridiales bacterium]|nr:coagulation factor 5/8 type domain-containing protein [Clostridiales bacterium]
MNNTQNKGEEEINLNNIELKIKSPFGDNIYVFSPEDNPKKVQQIIDRAWIKQEKNQFGPDRYAFLFMPGEYDESIKVKVGYYTHVAGLGILPTDTKINELRCDARWLGGPDNHNATCNFWRGVENINISTQTLWAVSQATFMRRMNINGSLLLHDQHGWASGGFLSDSKIESYVDSGTQQQWLSRNCDWDAWTGQNWNMVFVGLEDGKAPKGTWPGTKFTTVDSTPLIKEKPFLIYDNNQYSVFVPELQKDAKGISWGDGAKGETISIDEFYITNPEIDSSDTINIALSEGKNILLTAGIYELDKALEVKNPNTIILGIGYPTLIATNGNECMVVSDEGGINIAGILFDAGAIESENLLIVGKEKSNKNHSENPILISDVFFRVGGAASYPAKVVNCILINSNNVIGDNFWVWRADHGEQVAWDKNTAKNGVIINGDDVTIYALMVEHFQEYQIIWNGNGGKMYFYQSEIPYDVPNQEAWMSHNGTVNGFASYKVGDEVTSHEAWGLGIYSFHRDAVVDLNTTMEVPDRDGVKVHNICSVMITGNPGISHVINNSGEAANNPGDRKIIVEYENGIKK